MRAMLFLALFASETSPTGFCEELSVEEALEEAEAFFSLSAEEKALGMNLRLALPFASRLQAMDEEPLKAALAREEFITVRLTAAPSLGPMFTIRLSEDDTGYALFAKRYFRRIEALDTIKLHSQQIAVGGDDVAELEMLVFDSGILLEPPAIQDVGLDGVAWLLEVVAHGKYSQTIRWSPSPDSEFQAISNCLIEMAGWSADDLGWFFDPENE